MYYCHLQIWSRNCTDLPFTLNSQSIHDFHAITTMETMVIDNFLIIAYQLPTVESQHFTIYTLHSYPRKIEGGLTEVNVEFWLQLELSNTWIFVFPRSMQITIDCNGVIETIFMYGSGTLTIQSGCSAKTTNVDITASQEGNNRPNTNFETTSKTAINWPEFFKDVSVTLLDTIRSTSLPRVIDDTETDTLRQNSTSIKFIKSQTPTHQQLQPNEYIEFVTLYTTSALVLLATIIKLILLLKQRCQHSPSKTHTNRYESRTDSFEMV